MPLDILPVPLCGIGFNRKRKIDTVMKANWQPIETAPKDGTWILAIIEGDHPVYKEPFTPIVVQWDSNSWSDEIVNEYGEQNLSNWSPTHWMPLPEPPNKSKP